MSLDEIKEIGEIAGMAFSEIAAGIESGEYIIEDDQSINIAIGMIEIEKTFFEIQVKLVKNDEAWIGENAYSISQEIILNN